MANKVCSKCREEKDHSEFYFDKRVGLPRPSCKVCCKQTSAAWKEKNKDRKSETDRLHRLKNKEKIKARQSDWYQNNKEKNFAGWARRRATKVNATPSWLTQEHQKQIEELYWLAKDLQAVTGEPYHVDHIVPLQGENVSGLHVPWNLQILPADINCAKNNRYTGPDSWCDRLRERQSER